jgi:serine protease Do
MVRNAALMALFIVATIVLPAEAQREDAAARSVGRDSPTNVADLKALEQRIQRAWQKVAPAVVSVSGGTGVVVSEDGYVVTVAHVAVRADRDVTVTFPDGRRARAKTLGNDRGVDAGLIKITDEGPWPHAQLGNSKDLQNGQWCLALGYPVSFESGKPPVLRVGRILRQGSVMIATDCAIMGGDSGGPLVDLEGKIVGVGTRCDDKLTANYHIPIDLFHEGWKRLVAGEDFDSRVASVAFLGIAPDETAENARIGRVVPGSAAEKAGLRQGDVIVKFNATELARYRDLPPLVRKKKPGDRVTIEIRRGDQTLSVTATLGGHSG